MANSTREFNYPIVFKYVHGFLTVSIPDLGISEKIAVSKDFYTSEKLDVLKDNIWTLLSSCVKQGADHVQKKSWVPEASQIKHQLKKPEKDYSLPEFCIELKKHMSVSENTLRREIQKGKIICYTTEGGHRRIPASEIVRYLQTREVNRVSR